MEAQAWNSPTSQRCLRGDRKEAGPHTLCRCLSVSSMWTRLSLGLSTPEELLDDVNFVVQSLAQAELESNSSCLPREVSLP